MIGNLKFATMSSVFLIRFPYTIESKLTDYGDLNLDAGMSHVSEVITNLTLNALHEMRSVWHVSIELETYINSDLQHWRKC